MTWPFIRTCWYGKASLATSPRLQQARDLPCRDLGIMRGIGPLGYMARLGIQPVSGIFRHRPGDQCRRSLARILRVLPDFLAPLSLHCQERQRRRCSCTVPVIRYGTEPECAAGALLSHLEDMVDGTHHGFRRAEIGVQRVVPSSGGLARPQIGMNVGPPESIDGLLRVADQDQRLLRAVLLHPIDAIEDAVLHRIGILEFIDHRHRKLRPDPFGQPLSTFQSQCLRQLSQQVVEAHLASLVTRPAIARLDPACGMKQRRLTPIRQRRQLPWQGCHRRQRRMVQHGHERRILGIDILAEGVAQPIRRQAIHGRLGQSGLCHVDIVHPVTQQLQPLGLVVGSHLAAIEPADRKRPLMPCFRHRLGPSLALA